MSVPTSDTGAPAAAPPPPPAGRASPQLAVDAPPRLSVR